MTVLVTGGAGFIGSHVAEALVARGEEVVVLDDLSSGKRENLPDGVELVEGDIREPQDELFAGVKPTVCYHLAAQIDVRVSVERPDHDATDQRPRDGQHPPGRARARDAGSSSARPAAPSTASATAPRQRTRRACRSRRTGRRSSPAEEYLATYNRLLRDTSRRRCATETCTGRGRTRTARPGSSRSSSARCSSGETPKVFGDGSQTRDYVYVGDVVRATLAAAERDGGVYNVGTGRETSVVELLRAVPANRGQGRLRRDVHAAAPGRAPALRARHRAAPSTSSAGGPSTASRTASRETWE